LYNNSISIQIKFTVLLIVYPRMRRRFVS